MMTETIADGRRICLRRLSHGDLAQVGRFAFTVSIVDPLDNLAALATAHALAGFWTADAGAVAIVERASGRLLGTSQFYRPGPCVHGYELGYIIHDPANWGQGYATEAVRLFSDRLFEVRPAAQRHQLMIETWNTRSWRLAERCGFVREGLMRTSGLGGETPADSFIYGRTRNDWRQEGESPVSLGGLARQPTETARS
jgi:RimJ/RimL family protein N-acetyltransferase